MIELTPEERRNGWTAESLEAYRRQRESMTASRMFGGKAVIAGNIVTEYVKPRPAIDCQNATKFNPHKWGK